MTRVCWVLAINQDSVRRHVFLWAQKLSFNMIFLATWGCASDFYYASATKRAKALCFRVVCPCGCPSVRPVIISIAITLCLRRKASESIMFSGCPFVRTSGCPSVHPSGHYFHCYNSITTEANSFILIPVIDLTKVQVMFTDG